MDIYKTSVIPKIEHFINTKRARSTWANLPDYDGKDRDVIRLYYGSNKENHVIH